MIDRENRGAGRRLDRFRSLPGWELVDAGLDDLIGGRETIEGELVRSAWDRLLALGIVSQGSEPRPGPGRPGRLYELVEEAVGSARAHGRYNALRRRLSSFMRAAPHARAG